MDQLTVKDLLQACKKECQNGNGDKFIVVADDNEGNGYHGMFYAFTPVDEFDEEYFYDTAETNKNNLIILG